MIKQEKLLITSSNLIAKDTVELILKNNHISQNAKPGQFIHIQLDGFTLRRPISIADVDQEHGKITILFKTLGKGTKKLATYQTGQTINALGPLGNGFVYSDVKDKKALLIGGGIGVPPLYHLGKRLVESNIEVISILGYQTAESVFYEAEFRCLGDTYVVTDDGSYGYQGKVTDVIPEVGQFDTYYTCGPTLMLKAVQEKLENVNGYVSLEERMGCGVGACFACVVATKDDTGYKKICQDGPVFNAKEVRL